MAFRAQLLGAREFALQQTRDHNETNDSRGGGSTSQTQNQEGRKGDDDEEITISISTLEKKRKVAKKKKTAMGDGDGQGDVSQRDHAKTYHPINRSLSPYSQGPKGLTSPPPTKNKGAPPLSSSTTDYLANTQLTVPPMRERLGSSPYLEKVRAQRGGDGGRANTSLRLVAVMDEEKDLLRKLKELKARRRELQEVTTMMMMQSRPVTMSMTNTNAKRSQSGLHVPKTLPPLVHRGERTPVKTTGLENVDQCAEPLIDKGNEKKKLSVKVSGAEQTQATSFALASVIRARRGLPMPEEEQEEGRVREKAKSRSTEKGGLSHGTGPSTISSSLNKSNRSNDNRKKKDHNDKENDVAELSAIERTLIEMDEAQERDEITADEAEELERKRKGLVHAECVGRDLLQPEEGSPLAARIHQQPSTSSTKSPLNKGGAHPPPLIGRGGGGGYTNSRTSSPLATPSANSAPVLKVVSQSRGGDAKSTSEGGGATTDPVSSPTSSSIYQQLLIRLQIEEESARNDLYISIWAERRRYHKHQQASMRAGAVAVSEKEDARRREEAELTAKEQRRALLSQRKQLWYELERLETGEGTGRFNIDMMEFRTFVSLTLANKEALTRVHEDALRRRLQNDADDRAEMTYVTQPHHYKSDVVRPEASERADLFVKFIEGGWRILRMLQARARKELCDYESDRRLPMVKLGLLKQLDFCDDFLQDVVQPQMRHELHAEEVAAWSTVLMEKRKVDTAHKKAARECVDEVLGEVTDVKFLRLALAAPMARLVSSVAMKAIEQTLLEEATVDEIVRPFLQRVLEDAGLTCLASSVSSSSSSSTTDHSKSHDSLSSNLADESVWDINPRRAELIYEVLSSELLMADARATVCMLDEANVSSASASASAAPEEEEEEQAGEDDTHYDHEHHNDGNDEQQNNSANDDTQKAEAAVYGTNKLRNSAKQSSSSTEKHKKSENTFEKRTLSDERATAEIKDSNEKEKETDDEEEKYRIASQYLDHLIESYRAELSRQRAESDELRSQHLQAVSENYQALLVFAEEEQWDDYGDENEAAKRMKAMVSSTASPSTSAGSPSPSATALTSPTTVVPDSGKKSTTAPCQSYPIPIVGSSRSSSASPPRSQTASSPRRPSKSPRSSATSTRTHRISSPPTQLIACVTPGAGGDEDEDRRASAVAVAVIKAIVAEIIDEYVFKMTNNNNGRKVEKRQEEGIAMFDDTNTKKNYCEKSRHHEAAAAPNAEGTAISSLLFSSPSSPFEFRKIAQEALVEVTALTTRTTAQGDQEPKPSSSSSSSSSRRKPPHSINQEVIDGHDESDHDTKSGESSDDLLALLPKSVVDEVYQSVMIAVEAHWVRSEAAAPLVVDVLEKAVALLAAEGEAAGVLDRVGDASAADNCGNRDVPDNSSLCEGMRRGRSDVNSSSPSAGSRLASASGSMYRKASLSRADSRKSMLKAAIVDATCDALAEARRRSKEESSPSDPK